MSNGQKLNCYFQNSRSQSVAAGRGLTIEESLKAYSGYCVPAHHGRMCPKSTPVVQRVGEGCEIGKRRMYGSTCGEHFLANSMSEASLTGASALSTAVLHLPKKGRLCRKDQKGQGNEVDGGGRRRRYSSGKPLGLCVPGGSQARRKDAPKNSSAATWAGCAQTQTQASYRRSQLRFGPIAKTPCSTRHRTCLPHRTNRKKKPTQDGRKLRRYKRQYKVERTFSWLGNCRRLIVRYDRNITIYRAFFHIACLIITLRRL